MAGIESLLPAIFGGFLFYAVAKSMLSSFFGGFFNAFFAFLFKPIPLIVAVLTLLLFGPVLLPLLPNLLVAFMVGTFRLIVAGFEAATGMGVG